MNYEYYLLALGCVVTGSCTQKKIPDSAKQKTNIIYILADDLGYGDLSCYGQNHFQTPNIDRMACEGMPNTQKYNGTQ